MGLFSSTPKQIPILKAIITFDENNNVSIDFEKLHPELKTPEYIKIALHYYAKTLVDIDPEQNESPLGYKLLFSGIDSIIQTDLKRDSDILKIADIDDVVKLSNPQGKNYCYKATLFAIGGAIRHITTEIPSQGYVQQMVFSVPILIQGILQYLDEEEIKTLQLALKFMNEQYKNGFNFSDLSKWESIPVNAFLEAITGYK